MPTDAYRALESAGLWPAVAHRICTTPPPAVVGVGVGVIGAGAAPPCGAAAAAVVRRTARQMVPVGPWLARGFFYIE